MHENRYEQRLAIDAPRECAFDEIATVQGVRRWWTPIVTGSEAEVQVGFEGLDELIVLRREESHRPTSLHWTCLTHTGAEAWNGTTVTFDLAEDGSDRCELSLRHDGIAPELVAAGWRRFLPSLAELLETGQGAPYGHDALAMARRYHRAWTSGDFEAAADWLGEDLETDVPLNTYTTKTEFVEALSGFGSMVDRVELLSELEDGDEALMLYDMVGAPFGTIRIAENFAVRDGLIRWIRHVHDTVALRAAGFGSDPG